VTKYLKKIVIRAVPPKVELKGWGDNAIKVYPTNL
jgi:hypothetical protein